MESGGNRRSGLLRWAVRHRPSPAMLVALVALFVAMGGTTYAVTKLPRGSVGPAQIRKEAVGTRHIRDGAVTASKLAGGLPAGAQAPSGATGPAGATGTTGSAGSHGATGPAGSAGAPGPAGPAGPVGPRGAAGVSGARGATGPVGARGATGPAGPPGTVGLAARAGHADEADWALDSDKLDGKSASDFLSSGILHTIARFSLTNGQTRDVYSLGPFTLTARCLINQGGADTAEVLIATTQDNAALDGFDNVGDLDRDTSASFRRFIVATGAAGGSHFEASSDGTAVAPDGTEIRTSTLYAGVNLFGQPGKCFFAGYIVT